MQSSVVRVGICLPPSITVWSLTMMMKYDHIGKTDYVGHHQAGSA